MVCDHYCNEPLRCPTCIRRFWRWAKAHTLGRPRQKRGPQTALSFYEAAALFIDVDVRSKRSPSTS
jgi:hypothetical protein